MPNMNQTMVHPQSPNVSEMRRWNLRDPTSTPTPSPPAKTKKVQPQQHRKGRTMKTQTAHAQPPPSPELSHDARAATLSAAAPAFVRHSLFANDTALVGGWCGGRAVS